MRRLVTIAALWGCAGTSRPAPASPTSSVPFYISSRQSSYMIRGEFWGRVGQTAGTIHILIDSLTVLRPPIPPVSLDRIRVRPALAYQTPAGNWAIRTLGASIPVTGVPTLRDSLRGPAMLSLDIPKRFDASVDYLAFQFEFPDPAGSDETTTTYACGYSGMLVGSLPQRPYTTGDRYTQEC